MTTSKKTLTPGQATRRALQEATERRDTVQAELEAATVTLNATEAHMRQGDDTLTAEELIRARASVEVLTHRLAASESAVTRAERALRIDLEDTHLARAVAEHAAAILDAPAEAAVQRPATATGAMPYVVVLQTRAGGFDASTGEHSGSLELLFVRTDKHRELDAEALVEALKGSGVGIDYSRSHMQLRTSEAHLDGALADVLKLDILAATPRDSLPTIQVEVRSAMEAALRGVGGTLSREVRRRGEGIDPSRLGYVDPVRLGSGHANVNSGAIYYSKAGGQLDSERPEPFAKVEGTTVRDGIRAAVGSFGTFLSGEMYSVNELGRVAELVIQQSILGRCHGAIGRVESVEFVTSQQAGGRAVFAVYKVVGKSRTGA